MQSRAAASTPPMHSATRVGDLSRGEAPRGAMCPREFIRQAALQSRDPPHLVDLPGHVRTDVEDLTAGRPFFGRVWPAAERGMSRHGLRVAAPLVTAVDEVPRFVAHASMQDHYSSVSEDEVRTGLARVIPSTPWTSFRRQNPAAQRIWADRPIGGITART
jgi:hypothetical protein